VEEPEAAAREVEALVTSLGGFSEDASRESEGASTLRVRVPTAELESVLDRIAELGDEKERRTSAHDVTEQLADVEATLESKRQLRDRLRALLGRAEKVKDLLDLERELSRVQSDIDRMEGFRERLQGQVDLATVHVTLTPPEPRRVLGPLGYVAWGIAWFAKKLFVISP
jgi:FtsZ-binding cell division protein ZapB